MKKNIVSTLILISTSIYSFGQSKDQTIKQLSKEVDSLENELVILKRELRELKSSDPKLYDQKNLIEKQESQILKLTSENEKITAYSSRVESQLKFRSRELDDLKSKLRRVGADSLLSNIEVTNFKTMPQYAKNCACFYSQDQADYNNRQFLYIEDEKKDCLININGRQERLIFKKEDLFSNDNYTLKFINKKNIGNAGANKMFEAVIQITNTKGDKAEIPVTGVCGCE
jgi:predicted RNase H-like nuclease (RuvC/YqgF family)